MNPTIELLQAHRSVRKFKPDPVTDEQLQAIIHSAQMASSSSHVQAYSVIGVTDAEQKRKLAELSGNAYVAECPLFLVWCADLHRLDVACELHEVSAESLSTTESMIVATVDVTLAAQNAAIAAESLGLGIVYIGGIRNQLAAVSEMLKLPALVYPVYGMCVGYPAETHAQEGALLRPRLPQTVVYHQGQYEDGHYRTQIEAYDQTYRAYMLERSGGKIEQAWSTQMAARLEQPSRTHMRSFLAEKGFELK